MSQHCYKNLIRGILLVCAAALAGCSFSMGPRPTVEASEDVPQTVLRAYEDALATIAGGNDENAARQLERFVEKYPEYTNAYVNLALVKSRLGDEEAAEALLQQALVMDPANVYALNRMGTIYRQRGEFAAAQGAWVAATEANADYPNAWYNLGVLHDLYLQDLDAAVIYYERYQDLVAEADRDPAVARWIADLQRRLGGPTQTAQATGDF